MACPHFRSGLTPFTQGRVEWSRATAMRVLRCALFRRNRYHISVIPAQQEFIPCMVTPSLHSRLKPPYGFGQGRNCSQRL